MKKIKYSELMFPRGLNLHLLAEILPEKMFREFIVAHSRKDRKDRRIILPSHKTIKKVFFHYIWSQIYTEKTTWDKVKKSFRRDFGSLKESGVTKEETIRLFDQRNKEILKEKEKIERNL